MIIEPDPPISVLAQQTMSRPQRIQSYRVWELKRKLAEIAAATECAAIEVRMIACEER